MPRVLDPFRFVLIAVAGWMNQHQLQIIDYLREENRVLREQLSGRRVRFNDDQRRRLAAKAKGLGRRLLAEVATIVTPETLLAWHRKLIAHKYDGTAQRAGASENSPRYREVGGSTRRWASTTPEPDVVLRLEMRLGAAHARQRLGMEEEHEGQIFGAGINFLHIENWYSIHALTTIVLKASGLYWRGKKNAAQIIVRHNRIKHRRTPQEFRGFTVLQLSDLHCDTCPLAMKRLREILPKF